MNSELTREQIIKWHTKAIKLDAESCKELTQICTLALRALDMEPKPIADAPKDGRWVLGRWPQNDRWKFNIIRWFSSEECEEGGYFEDRSGCRTALDPTHFIPLSALPTPKDVT